MFPQQQYYPPPNVIPIEQPEYQGVKNVIPSIFPGLLGTIQLFLWIAIIVLEAVSVYYDAGRGTVYAGFWCSIVFFVTWVSMFCYLCCGKSSGCGNYLVIQNTINLCFVIILLIFTSRFIQNPCLCYGYLCFTPNWDYIYDGHDDPYLCTDSTYRKLPVLKGLLACAVLMLSCNVLFIATYLIISLRQRAKERSNIQQPDVVFHRPSATVQMRTQPPPYQPPESVYPSHQHHQMYPVLHTQEASQWSSAPPPTYEIHSDKF